MCGCVGVVCVKGMRTCVCGHMGHVWGCAFVCVTSFLVQFVAETSHLLAASIEMAHLIGCTLCT